MKKISLIIILLILYSHAREANLEKFSILPPFVSEILVQKNSEWEWLSIVLKSPLPANLAPVLTDSTVELSIESVQEHSSFHTTSSSIARGVAWSENKFVIYLHIGQKPAVIITQNKILLQSEIKSGKLENRLAFPTGLKSSVFYLPSYEPLASAAVDFAASFAKKQTTESSLAQTIQVKRSDASYIVTEDIISLFPSPSEGRPMEALEFGTRLKVLERRNPFYKVRYRNKEGYVYQRDLILEADLTTSQKDKLRRLNKESPGGVDSVATMYGWRDSDKIVYSSYGYRDPFIEVKSEGKEGIVIDNLVLAGVIYENQMPMALFSDNKVKGQSYTLYEGDTIKNGRIIKISRNDVLFLLQEYGVSRRYKMILPDKYGGDK